MGLVLNMGTSVVQGNQPISMQKCIKIKVQHCFVTSEGLIYKQSDHKMVKASLGV